MPQTGGTAARHDPALEAACGVGSYEWWPAEDRRVWSPGLIRMYGLSRAPAAEEDFSRLVHPEDRVRVEAKTSAYLGSDAESFSHSFRIVRPDGSVRFILDRGAIERDKKGIVRVVRGLNIDLTDESRTAHGNEIEEKLRESAATLLHAQRCANAGVWDVDLITNRVTWSEPYYELYGLPKSVEPSHESWIASIHPDDRKRVDDEFASAIAGQGAQRIEFRILRNGQVRWLHSEGRVICDSANRPLRVTGITWDITKRRQAEAALRESEERERLKRQQLEAILEAIPAAVFISNDPDCAHMSLNRAGHELLRLPADADASKSAPEGKAPQHFEVESKGRILTPGELPLQRAAATKSAIEGAEFKLRFVDGDCKDFLGNALPLLDESGAVRGAVGAFIDITERKKIEAALRESEERYRQLADAMPQLVWTASSEGVVDYYNARAVEYGISASRPPISNDWQSAIHPDDLASTWEAWREAVARDQTYQKEHRLLMADGSYRWHLSRGQPQRNEEGAIVKWFGASTDIDGFKRAGAALRASEERLRLAVEAGCMATWDWHIPTGAVQWNEEHYRMLGYAPGEVKPSYEAWTSRVLPEDFPPTEALLQRTLERGGDYQAEFRVLGQKDQIRWLEARGRFERDNEGRPIRCYGVMMDVDERKRAEAALRASEERERQRRQELETMLSVIPAAVLIGEDRACVQISANQAGYKLLRIPEGRNVSKSAPEDERPAYETYSATGELLPADQLPMQRAAAAGKSIAGFEHELRFADGGHKHVLGNALPLFDAAGEVRGAVAALLDITERRHIEEALRASEERLRRVLETDAVGVLFLDREGTLTDANDVFLQMTGYTRQEVKSGKLHWRTLTAPEWIAVSEAQLEKFEVTGRIGPYEKECFRKDGSRTWMLFAGRDLGDGAIVEFAIDITERKQQEERIRLLLREVNHRAKNMLAVVQSVARQTAAASPEVFLERFSDRIQALAASQDLLVKSDWRGVELAELVRGQLVHFKDLIGSRIELEGPSVLLSASAAQSLGMAIHELSANAGKYGALSVAEGRVAIGWGLERDGAGSETFTMRWCEQGGPSASAPSRSGFGSMVICELAESSLNAKVDLDFTKTGLNWRLRCPAAGVVEGTRSPPAAEVRSEASAPVSSRPRVLVVEDEALIAMEIAHVLTEANFEVLGPARAVAEALSLIEETGCDAAVLDINLRGETSEPVARKLMADGTSFVTLSGYSRAQHPQIFAGVPALAKPLRPALLVAEVKRCITCKEDHQGQLPG